MNFAWRFSAEDATGPNLTGFTLGYRLHVQRFKSKDYGLLDRLVDRALRTRYLQLRALEEAEVDLVVVDKNVPALLWEQRRWSGDLSG